MGTVLDLRLRQPASGDWTSLERSQLYALVDQLPTDPGREVVLGVTDAGDPWFVVISSSDEVELHVARIGGRFVVHRGDEDRVSEAPDLWTAAARAGGLGLPERRATVTSLFGDPLPVHTLAALETPAFDGAEPAVETPAAQPAAVTAFATAEIVTLAFASESEARAAAILAADLPSIPITDETVRAVPVDIPPAATASEHLILMPVVAGAVAAPTILEAAPVEISDRATALAGGETLIGTEGADTLIGGDGDDVLDGGGVRSGGVDLLDGRGGADRMMLSGSVIAIGGTGKDAFFVFTRGEGNFGVVLDFFESRDDRLEFAPGSKVKILEVTPEDDVLAGVRFWRGAAHAPAVPGARVILDVDGDGKADGFVLLADTHGWSAGRSGLHSASTPSLDRYSPLFNNNALSGMEARTLPGHGQAPVLTAYQMGPDLFADHAGAAHVAAAPLLHIEDLAPPAIELFG